MRIEVWSDVACPWCWLGKRHLEEALRRTGVQAQVEMRSFELDPSRRETTDARSYLVRRFGSAQAVDAAQSRLAEAGARVGLPYDFSRQRIANTFDAHRVHHFAKTRGLGDVVMERLFRAYHGEGEDLSDAATLTRLAVEAGLAEGDVREVLAGDAYADAVRHDEAQAYAVGVRGVPFFVVDGRIGLSGAQPVEVFERALAAAAAPPA